MGGRERGSEIRHRIGGMGEKEGRKRWRAGEKDVIRRREVGGGKRKEV